MDNSSKVEMDYKQDSHYEETVMMKSPKTYEEQVKIIKKKGSPVTVILCESFLKQANSNLGDYRVLLYGDAFISIC